MNFDNLIQVEINKDGSKHDAQVVIVTINTCSIRNEEQLVLRELNHLNIDMRIVTETWLKDNDDDQWLKNTDLNREPYQCHVANRIGSVGGGIMLICKSDFGVKLLQKTNEQSFEHMTWALNIKKRTLTVTGIYHPLPKNQVMNGMFIDEVMEFLTGLLTNNQDNLILRDFNLHIDDPGDTDANLFIDTLTAFRLKQHINVATHFKGNTSDLILTELLSHTVGKVRTGAMLSDHITVYASLNIKKTPTHKGKASIRKISAITDEALCQEFNDDLPFEGDLDSLITKLNGELAPL